MTIMSTLHSFRSYHRLSFIRLSILLSTVALHSLICSANTLTSRNDLPEIQEDSPLQEPPKEIQPTCIQNNFFNLHWPTKGLPGQDRYYRRPDYGDISELCLAVLPNGQQNQKPNFACVCNRYGEILCSNTEWAPDVSLYCDESCDCPRPKRHRPKWLKFTMKPFEKRWQRFRAARRASREGASNGIEEIPVSTMGGSDVASSSRQTCAGQCWGYNGCSSIRNQDGCEDAVCGVGRVDPINRRLVLGGCVSVSTILRKGKRDLDQISCLCNQTYVSEKCCWEESGLVYENSLGMLGGLQY